MMNAENNATENELDLPEELENLEDHVLNEEEITCVECGTTEPWGSGDWCPICGYYPALGTKVELESNEYEPQPFDENLWEMIPRWVYTLLAGMAAIALISLMGKLLLTKGSALHAYWLVIQLTIGLTTTLIAHGLAYLFSVRNSDKMGPFDIFMKPVLIWKNLGKATLKDETLANRIWMLGWGLTSLVCAVILIGGVRFSAIYEDWGFEPPPKKDLMNAIVNEVHEQRKKQKDSGSGSLEDSVNKLAEDETDNSHLDLDPRERLKAMPKMDCLVLGYFKDEESFSSIVIAAMIENKLKVVGTIPASDVPDDLRKTLLKKMKSSHRKTPFIRTNYKSATWLEPKVMCRIAYEKISQGGKLIDPHFFSMLSDFVLDSN